MLRTRDNHRLFIGIALFTCVFVLPSMITLVLGGLLVLQYTKYYEFPLAALLVDALYQPYGHTTIGLFGLALLYVIFVDYLRVRIRMRDNRKLY
jgi:hypothetical protein